MEVVLNIGAFFIIITGGFLVGCIFGSRYVLYLLNKEGYRKAMER